MRHTSKQMNHAEAGAFTNTLDEDCNVSPRLHAVCERSGAEAVAFAQSMDELCRPHCTKSEHLMCS